VVWWGDEPSDPVARAGPRVANAPTPARRSQGLDVVDRVAVGRADERLETVDALATDGAGHLVVSRVGAAGELGRQHPCEYLRLVRFLASEYTDARQLCRIAKHEAVTHSNLSRRNLPTDPTYETRHQANHGHDGQG
jgi:hypothetical protein